MKESVVASSFTNSVPENIAISEEDRFWSTEGYYKKKLSESDFISPETAEKIVDADENVDYLDSNVPAKSDYEMTEDPEYHRMTEAIDNEESLIIDYLNKTESPSFEEFCTEADVPGSFKLKQKYDSLLKSMKYEEKEYSSFAKELLQANKSFHEEALTPKQTADEKYDSMYDAVKGIIDGTSLKKHAFICGQAGVGKSWYVKKSFNDNWASSPLKAQGYIYSFDKGSIGKSTTALTAYLYSHRDREIIVLDDCDGFLKSGDDEVLNLLKGVLDSENIVGNLQPIHTNPSIRKMAGQYVTDRSAKDTDVYKPSVREHLVHINERLLDEGILSVSIDGKEAARSCISLREADMLRGKDKLPPVPADFTFSSRLIMISNLAPKEVNDAFRSRCIVIPLVLTHKEFCAHLKDILPGMMKELETSLPKKVVFEIRDTVYEWLSALIELEGQTLFGKKIIIRCPLQFRLIPDFAQMFYMAMVSYMEKYREDLEKIEGSKMFSVIAQGIQPRVVRQMIDTLSDDVYRGDSSKS